MEIRKGSLRSFDSTAYTATVQMAGSLATWLEGVPVSRGIPEAQMTAGRACAVIIFDAANPRDAVVTAVWA